jgi:prevent-host-death family protein
MAVEIDGLGRIWKFQDAKARLSEVLRLAKSEGPQTVTVHGRPTAVIVDLEGYEIRKKTGSGETLKSFVEESRRIFARSGGLDDDFDFTVRMPPASAPRNPFED